MFTSILVSLWYSYQSIHHMEDKVVSSKSERKLSTLFSVKTILLRELRAKE